MSSQAKTYAISAGGKVQLSGGTAFALLSTEAVVDVTVWRGGSDIAKFIGVQGGLNWRSRDGKGSLLRFDFLEINSAVAQSVVAFSGDGDVDYSRSQGEVSIISNSPVWQGRNPLKVAGYYQTDAIAPQGLTNRFTYTVPAGRVCLIRSLFINIYRVTAAAPVGIWAGLILAGGNYVIDLRSIRNAAHDSLGPVAWNPEIWLGAGQTCIGQTSDLSTGGTVSYSMAMSGIEFDA